MNEFLKLKWDSTSDASYLEKQACSFIPNEVLLDSYVYQNLKKRLPKQKKIVGLSNVVTFFPGRKYLPKFPRSSSLSKLQLEHCLNALKLMSQNTNQLKQSESYSLEVFTKLSGKIAVENAAFNDFVKQLWESDRVLIARLRNNLYKYALMCFHERVQRYLEYKNCYREEILLSTTCNEQDNVTVEVNCIKNLLELGTLARFSQPSLKFECRLSAQTLPPIASNIRSYSKLPVSQDQNIRQLLEENDFDVVISSSGLKRLLDNTDPKSKWSIPVTIELIKVKRENESIMKKIVFIDKPLIQSHQDPIDLKYFSMKRLVKTNFCQYEAFSFEKQDTYPNEKLASFNEKLIELEKRMNGSFDKVEEQCTETSQEHEQKEDNEMIWKKKKGKPDKIHHNVNYRLWKFKQIVNNSTLMKNSIKNTELNLLVRSKLDGCETTPSGTLQPVIVKPKIELQLQYGANIPTKSELSREWTSLFFRPFSNLYRVRMHWNTAEVVNIEKCTLQKVTSEATSLYQFNPNLGLGMLNNLLNELSKLGVGNYLLVHLPKHEFFVSLLVECESPLSTVKLHSELKKCEIDTDIKRSWVPIDLNFILPIHEFHKRPPGCFEGALRFKKRPKGAVGCVHKNKQEMGMKNK